VPIATQSASSVTDPDAPIVNSISFRDTGVILSVTPRVSDSGRVVLDIEQEVSDVVETTSSGIDSPTIQQRKIKTTVAVNDSEALALGGLIQESKNLSKNQVPVAGDIPIFGNLFKQKEDKIRRTELIIIIRPHVVRDINEARWVTEEFRKQLNVNPGTRLRKRPGLRENADRILLQ
jgi:general secretion pathway protein D